MLAEAIQIKIRSLAEERKMKCHFIRRGFTALYASSSVVLFHFSFLLPRWSHFSDGPPVLMCSSVSPRQGRWVCVPGRWWRCSGGHQWARVGGFNPSLSSWTLYGGRGPDGAQHDGGYHPCWGRRAQASLHITAAWSWCHKIQLWPRLELVRCFGGW